MEPVVDGLQGTYSDRMSFVVYKDVEGDMDINQFAMDQGVRAVPTMMLVSADGVELQRWEGTATEQMLITAFEGNL
jgi:hypothetical protein